MLFTPSNLFSLVVGEHVLYKDIFRSEFAWSKILNM